MEVMLEKILVKFVQIKLVKMLYAPTVFIQLHFILMGQEEIYKLLKKKPRLTTKQIAEMLNYNISKASTLLSKLVRSREVSVSEPTKDELHKIIQTYPCIVTALYKIKVFEVNSEDE